MTSTLTDQPTVDAAWTDWCNARDELERAKSAEAEPCNPAERRRRRVAVDEKRDIEEMCAESLRLASE